MTEIFGRRKKGERRKEANWVKRELFTMGPETLISLLSPRSIIIVPEHQRGKTEE